MIRSARWTFRDSTGKNKVVPELYYYLSLDYEKWQLKAEIELVQLKHRLKDGQLIN